MKHKVFRIIKKVKKNQGKPKRTADDFIRALLELSAEEKGGVGAQKKASLAKYLKCRRMFSPLVSCQNCNGKGGWMEVVPIFEPRYYSNGGTPEDFQQVGTERRWHPCFRCKGRGVVRGPLRRLQKKLAKFRKKRH